MKNFSYTRTPELNQQLQKIEELRKELILKSLSPKSELSFQWNNMSNHIHYSFSLTGIILPNTHIQTLLSPEGKKHLSDHEKMVISYKSGLDYLYHNWLVNSEPVLARSFIELYDRAFTGTLKISTQDLENALKYIQINPEYPVIQAALAQFMTLDLYPFSDNNELFSHLVFLMFLYKTGYDFRRMINLEEYFFKDIANYKDLITKLRRQTNITEWLEYVTSGIVTQLTQCLKNISIEKQSPTLLPNTLQLNERQQDIVRMLEQPGIKINNSIVQKRYNISQITASRDLAKLTTLGLLFPLGKGRSTYYTKV